MYTRDGRLPLGIGDVGVGEQVVEQSDLGIVILEKHFTVYEGLALAGLRHHAAVERLYPRGRALRGRLRAPRAAAAPEPFAAMNRFERLFASRWGLLVIFVVFLGAYLGASGGRLRQHSPYNHFVYLAEGWLKGRLDMPVPPPNENDWARVEVLHLKDGRTLKGMFGKTGPTDRFYPLRGPSLTIDNEQIASRSGIRYVSFPPFPAVVMLPFVAMWHLAFNDVIFTVMWAALNPVLLFLLLGSLRRRGYRKRSVTDDLWLTVMLGRGLGLLLLLGAGAGLVHGPCHRRDLCDWLCLGQRSRRRAPPWPGCSSGSALPRARRWDSCSRSSSSRPCAWPAAGSACASGAKRVCRLACWPSVVRFACRPARFWRCCSIHNFLRFEQFTVFGHEYLNIAWQDRIQKWGLFNLALPVAQPGLRPGAAAAHFRAVTLREGRRARHVHAGDLAQPGLHRGAARAQPTRARPVDHYLGHRAPLACSTRTRATSSSATASAWTTWSSSSCCSRWAIAGSPCCGRPCWFRRGRQSVRRHRLRSLRRGLRLQRQLLPAREQLGIAAPSSHNRGWTRRKEDGKVSVERLAPPCIAPRALCFRRPSSLSPCFLPRPAGASNTLKGLPRHRSSHHQM